MTAGDGLREGGKLLDLPEECLAPGTATRLHVATIESVILFPGLRHEDTAARLRSIHSATVEFRRHNPFGQDLDFDLFALAADAWPIGELKKQAEKPFGRGLIAGHVLRETVGRVDIERAQAHAREGQPNPAGLVTKRATLGAVIADIARDFRSRSGGLRNRNGKVLVSDWRWSAKTFNTTDWPRYRIVAHFWAAYVERALSGKDEAFPCAVSKIGDFLAEADAFRERGEACRTHMSPGPLLRPGDAIRAPFALRKVPLAFEQAAVIGGR